MITGSSDPKEQGWLNEFKAALENGDLELHYQPIVSLPGQNVVGLEALIVAAIVSPCIAR